jgi:hypothetical protein
MYYLDVMISTPIPFPDASVCKINFLEKSGLRKTGSLQIQSFSLSNAFCVVSDHLTLFGTFFFVRSVKGTDMSENWYELSIKTYKT